MCSGSGGGFIDDGSQVQFRLRSLNLSHNNLGYLVHYVAELGLISSELESLMLVNCLIDDEHFMRLVDSGRLNSLITLDLSG